MSGIGGPIRRLVRLLERWREEQQGEIEGIAASPDEDGVQPAHRTSVGTRGATLGVKPTLIGRWRREKDERQGAPQAARGRRCPVLRGGPGAVPACSTTLPMAQAATGKPRTAASRIGAGIAAPSPRPTLLPTICSPGHGRSTPHRCRSPHPGSCRTRPRHPLTPPRWFGSATRGTARTRRPRLRSAGPRAQPRDAGPRHGGDGVAAECGGTMTARRRLAPTAAPRSH